MLRDQSAFGPMDFLTGRGEMAGRIRAFDWSNHPFGPPETWPQSLRSALSICLNSAFPTAIYWGPELRLLYNDAWAPVPGPRHPASLGARAKDVWSDIWHIIQPQFDRLIHEGEGLFLEGQMLPMRRTGFEEETYWTYSLTPLRAEDGAIAGIFNSGSEMTETVLQKRNAEFLITLNRELRVCETADDALHLAVTRVGELLGAARVGIRKHASLNGKPAFALTYEWRADGVAASDHLLDLACSMPEKSDDLMSGRILSMSLSDPGLQPAGRRFLEKAGVASLLAIPWIEDRKAVSVIFIHHCEERSYSPLDISAAERVLETTMGWIERERHRDRERVMAAEIDHRARNLLAVIQSITRITKGTDADDVKAKLSDRFAALSRVHSLLGSKRWIDVDFRDLLEDELAPLGTDIYDRVSIEGPHVPLPAADAQLIAMMLHELTTNALKYGSLRCDKGHLSVTWSIDAERNMALQWIESGLPTNVGSGADDHEEGFGSLLLSNVVRNQFNGEVERTWREDGLGYRFQLSLDRGASGPVRDMPADARKTGSEPAAPSVMVVEDDGIIALDLADMLESEGYHVLGQFGTVDTALAALGKYEPDIVLLDADLRGRSSAPVAEVLSVRSIPFVVVSGHGDAFPEDDPRSGAPRLEKPISPADLISTVRRAIG
ncbi:HWE histidine kinase domain-containing protein [Palleronia sp. LCG004]|uniref:HWE histidine kinase domain-containing protein n=1 Tax=Palleronia sp. LCG004 TaxID=3079304 RepID=UPI00294310B8|nr:HWE histidine kinase domain-containing protein [Palleronia sp. LCG004]WOI58026.1 HWE histidine kinase domain-containing protein [Palleronia sp. LCG004]